MKIRLSTSQVQKQILSPIMQQSIEVLMLPLTDLSMAIETELQNNPLLEVNEERADESLERKAEQDKEDINTLLNAPEFIFHGQTFDDEEFEEKPLKTDDSLEQKLLREVHIALSTPGDIAIAELIIGNLNEDGYLTMSCEEIARMLKLPSAQRAQAILTHIQTLEPIGVGARSLQECLLIQLKIKYPDHRLAQAIIQKHFNDLGHKRYAEIAKKLSVRPEDVKQAARIIATLEPKPARNSRPLPSNLYIKPDVVIYADEKEELQIHVNREGIPVLRINALYKSLLKQNNLKPEEEEFIREKLKNALHFIRSIEQRGQTLRNITKYILDKQRKFFHQGHSAMTPMSLKDVAQALDRNESTISRAISGKYIDTPQGLLPVKFFFSHSIGEQNGNGGFSNRSIKEEIRDIIEAEDKSKPLSDQEIVKIFASRGMPIARRTVSKYRQSLKILPTHLRKS